MEIGISHPAGIINPNAGYEFRERKERKKSTQFYNIPSEEQGLHKSPFILYDPREN